jgi:hypothetical protein
VATTPGETQDAEQRMLGAVPGVPALGRGGLHAGAERPLRDRRRQHAERAAADQAPRRRGNARRKEVLM